MRLRSHRSGTDGAGLGLFIVRELVQSMGGSASLESVLGEGSCFGFTVPIAVASVAEHGRATHSV